MHPGNKVTVFLSVLLLFFANTLNLAQGSSLFQVEVRDNDINIRSDSTANSPAICKVNRGELLSVVLEHYGWYKIVLPLDTPVFIKDDFLAPVDAKSARVIRDRVNIRVGPSDSFAVIGMAKKDQLVKVLDHKRGWYRIEPIDSCFGWIHKQFTKKLTDVPPLEPAKNQNPASAENKVVILGNPSQDTNFSATGIINPYGMVLKRPATHKLITEDKGVFLLKGNKEKLNALTCCKVKVSGKIISGPKEKYPVIEVTRLEQLD